MKLRNRRKPAQVIVPRESRRSGRAAWWAIAAMSVALLSSTPCRAANVTYTFVNHPDLQAGTNGGTYTISGTITTDGSTLLETNNILAWTLTASNPVPGNPTLTLSSSDPGAEANVYWEEGDGGNEYQPYADSTGIYLPTGPGGQSRINLYANGFAYNFGSYGIPNTEAGVLASQGITTSAQYWLHNMPNTGGVQVQVQYASAVVPEPASITLALLAAGLLSCARPARRK